MPHLNSTARHSAGWDILQFRVEEADEQYKGRKIDLVASPSGATIIIEGRRHTDFDSLMPIECKRLPTPKGTDRDEREYVVSQYSSTGGIQRFKAGHHGAAHAFGAMIGYSEGNNSGIANARRGMDQRIDDATEPGWTVKDLLSLQRRDAPLRLTIFRSLHERRNGLPEIELRHLWIEMN